MVTNHMNASGWGAGNQSDNNAAADNHWIDSIGAPDLNDASVARSSPCRDRQKT
jgi:hypothetical protein